MKWKFSASLLFLVEMNLLGLLLSPAEGLELFGGSDSELEELKSELTTCTDNMEKLEGDLVQSKRKVKQAQDEYEAAEDKFKKANNTLSEVKKQKSTLEDDIIELTMLLDKRNKDYDEVSKKLAEKEEDLANAKKTAVGVLAGLVFMFVMWYVINNQKGLAEKSDKTSKELETAGESELKARANVVNSTVPLVLMPTNQQVQMCDGRTMKMDDVLQILKDRDRSLIEMVAQLTDGKGKEDKEGCLA